MSETVHQAVTGGVATKADIAELKADIAELKTELKWIKIIGGTIVGLLILPWLASFLGANLPGP